jgi:outer membrane lipoprotein-sorting protein
VDAPENSPAGVRALKLVPRKPQPDYDWLILLVDPTTLALKGLVTSDSQGGTSSLAFQNLKENVGLADKEFVFNVPRGVEIINDAGR